MPYTTEFRKICGGTSIILDVRCDGKLIKTSTGDSKENALLRATSELETQAEQGKLAGQAATYLRSVKL